MAYFRKLLLLFVVTVMTFMWGPDNSVATMVYNRIDPFNYGSIYLSYRGEGYGSNSLHIESTNSPVPPYHNTVSVRKSTEGYVPHYNGGSSIYSYDKRAIIEFDVDSILNANYFYLILSPWSVYASNDITEKVDVLSYRGDGYVQEEDYASGVYVGFADIVQPDSSLSWYTSNDVGGYLGDTMFEITDIVNSSIIDSMDYLGFNLQTQLVNLASYTGVLFRKPYILAVSESTGTSSIPEPSTIMLFVFGIAGLAGVRFRKKRSL